jgi:hypothetical protein
VEIAKQSISYRNLKNQSVGGRKLISITGTALQLIRVNAEKEYSLYSEFRNQIVVNINIHIFMHQTLQMDNYYSPILIIITAIAA